MYMHSAFYYISGGKKVKYLDLWQLHFGTIRELFWQNVYKVLIYNAEWHRVL